MRRHVFSARLKELTEEIVESYTSPPAGLPVTDLNLCLPSREGTTRILDGLLGVFYPGYRGAENLDGHTVRFHIGALLDEVTGELSVQVFRAFEFGCRDRGDVQEECARKAEQAVKTFLDRLPGIRRSLLMDVNAAYDGDPAATGPAEILFAYPGLVAITVYRVAHELHDLGVPLLPRIMTEHAHSLTGIDIHPGARIGKSFFIDHGTGVVIGETTEIGDNVRLYQGVTLGGLSFEKDDSGRAVRGTKRHPTICDSVVVYANATILGGTTVIGEGSVIGGNTFVIASVPPYTKVVNEVKRSRVEPSEKRGSTS